MYGMYIIRKYSELFMTNKSGNESSVHTAVIIITLVVKYSHDISSLPISVINSSYIPIITLIPMVIIQSTLYQHICSINSFSLYIYLSISVLFSHHHHHRHHTQREQTPSATRLHTRLPWLHSKFPLLPQQEPGKRRKS